MVPKIAIVAALLVLLPSCSKGREEGSSSVAGESSSPAADVGEEAPQAGSADRKTIKVSIPQIAYIFRYSFDLPEDRVTVVQNRHIAACDALGAARCRVLAMQNSGGKDGKAEGALSLSVDARLARAFGAKLGSIAGQAGGTESEASIEGEDLSKQIVDTEARLRAKQALADRLVTLLKTRNGPVADLVAAERAVADVQEEIDAAQSWLADARGRVAMSRFEISYRPSDAGIGFLAPLRESTAGLASLAGSSLAALVMLVAALLPWLGAAALIFFGVRHVRRRYGRHEEE